MKYRIDFCQFISAIAYSVFLLVALTTQALGQSGYPIPKVRITMGGEYQSNRDLYGLITSKILLAINKYYANEITDLKEISEYLSDVGYDELISFLRNNHFFVENKEIRAFISYNGSLLEVRKIPVYIVTKDSLHGYGLRRYIVIGFNPNPKPQLEYIRFDEIPNLRFMRQLDSLRTQDQHLYRCLKLFTDSLEKAYNEKDIAFLRKVYIDTAVILVGKDLTFQKRSRKARVTRGDYKYITSTGKQYLDRLESKFQALDWIRIQYDSLSYKAHPLKLRHFVVEFYQTWSGSDGYSDYGWVFLFVEIDKNDNSLIYIRVWWPVKDLHDVPPLDIRDVRLTSD